MSVILISCIGVTGVVLLLWVFQRSLIYFPVDAVPTPSDVGLREVETVTFPTTDGLTLNGWFVHASTSSSSVTFVVFNGNAGNRAYRASLAAWLQRRGVQVLLFDYRGYGGNEGIPTEAGLAADARAARTYLLTRKDVDASRLVYFGESLGSAVAIALAAQHPPAGLILRSPFTSLADVGQVHYPFLPVRFLLRDRFPSRDTIRQVRSPVLVIAGAADRIVPVDQSRQVYEATSLPKKLVILPAVDHNDPELLSGEAMVEAVVRFLEQLGDG